MTPTTKPFFHKSLLIPGESLSLLPWIIKSFTFFFTSNMSGFSANVDSSMNSLNGGKAPLSLHRADISNNYGTNYIFQGNCGSSFVGMNSFLQENAARCDHIAFTLATQTVAAAEACCLQEKYESIMMDRRTVMNEFARARAIVAIQTVAAVEACRLKEKLESLMMERHSVMKELVRARASAAQTFAAVEACRLEETFECLMMERRSALKEFVRACAISAAQTRLEDKWESLMMESHSVMEEFVRYRAIEALTAEESIRIGKNMIRWELPRLDTTRVAMGCGGSGTGTETDAGTHMDSGSQGLSWEKVQSSIESSFATKSQDSDSVLMALAEKFQIPVNRPNMMCRPSTYNFVQCSVQTHEGNRISPHDPPAPDPIHASSPAPSLTGDRKIKDACKHKKDKADDGPRRPLSAYNIFFSEMRAIILEESEEGVVETGNEEQLREFTLRACKDDAKVPRDLRAFTQNLMNKRQSTTSRKRVHKKSHGKVSFLTLVKTVGQRWRELPQHQKKKYEDLANLDRARYRNEIKAAEERLEREVLSTS